MTAPATRGVHHLGLTVSRLEESAAFFTSVLGWTELRRDLDYPAVFVGDGTVMVSLWKNRREPAVAFDRERNVGLQHAAFAVESREALERLHARLMERGVPIQFPPAPRPSGGRHLFCFEPSGIRLEFVWPG